MYILGTVLFVLSWWASGAEAACSGSGTIWTCTAGSTPADIQSAIDSASSRATIALESGSYSWANSVSWTNKQIHIKGAGQGSTIITRNGGPAFTINMTTGGTHNWRISNMTFLTSDMRILISINGSQVSAATKGWRVDHITVTNSATPTNPFFYIQGVTWGLIDHATFNGFPFQVSAIYGFVNSGDEGTNCTPHCYGYVYWNRNLNFGTDEAVYFEDVLIDFDGSGGIADPFDLVFGGSAVLRYSTINGAYFMTHSTRDDAMGGMKYEVYNNTFNGNGALRAGLIRSGTGVIFNNTVSGFISNQFDIDGQRENTNESCLVSGTPLFTCNGASGYDGNVDANGWPCLGACGRGAVAGFDGTAATQSNTPIYGWKNGSTGTCATGGTCNNSVTIKLNIACGAKLANYLKPSSAPHANKQFDYANNGDTPKPGYMPYTYPHPLTVGGSADITAPSAPINLVIR